MIWFHRASDFSQWIRTVAIAIVIDAEHSTIFTSHTLDHLIVRMSTMGMHYALSIGVAMVANKKALFATLVDRVPQFDAH